MEQTKKQKIKYFVISHENFEKLRKFGYANDSMNDVITKILNIRLESGSRVGELAKF